MNDDGRLLKCQNKSELIHALERVVDKKDLTETEVNKSKRHLIIDAMAVRLFRTLPSTSYQLPHPSVHDGTKATHTR